MRCPYCGRETPSAARACAVCGKPLSYHTPASDHPPVQRTAGGRAPAQRPANTVRRPVSARPGAAHPAPARRKKRRSLFLKPGERWNPKFLAACAGVLACIVLIPILIALIVHHHTDEPLQAKAIQTFYSKTSNKTSVVFAGKKFEKAVTGKIASTSVSEDGLIEAALTEDGALYYITTEKVEPVSSNVLNYVLSADGSRLAYVIDTNSETEGSTTEAETEKAKEEPTTKERRLADEGTTEETTEYVPAGGEQYMTYQSTSLFLYIAADGTEPVVANHVAPDSITISPHGAYVGYVITAEDGESFEGFFSNNGTTVSLGRNTLPLAASEDGLLSYYIKYEQLEDIWVQKLFIKVEKKEAKLGEFTDGKRFGAYFNRDCSEIVFGFTGPDGAFFHYTDGRDKQKLANGFTPLLARGTRIVEAGRAKIVPFDTFAKCTFVRSDGTAQYVDGKFNCLDTGVQGKLFRITPDGKTFYALSADGLLVECAARKADKREIAAFVMNFDLSPDGSTLYYVNMDNEMHIVSGRKDSVAAVNVYAPGEGLCVTDGGYLYFLQDYTLGRGTLCYLKDTGKAHVLEDLNDVHDIAADTDDNIYYRGRYTTTSGTYDLYYGRQKKYTMLFKDMG